MPEMPDKSEKQDDRNRNTQQPKQNSATHGNLLMNLAMTTPILSIGCAQLAEEAKRIDAV
jgi:hypothetical protein